MVSLALAGCRAERAEPPPVAGPDSAAVAAARAAANTLAGDLMGMLMRVLQERGPQHAIAFCADSAQAVTARHQEQGITVRRVGTRVRNPVNTPDSVERAVLERFAATIASGAAPTDTAFILPGDYGPELRYLRPIVVAQPCLTCHGDPAAIPPAVRQTLVARYPADQATGYRAGELRGAVSVRQPAR